MDYEITKKAIKYGLHKVFIIFVFIDVAVLLIYYFKNIISDDFIYLHLSVAKMFESANHIGYNPVVGYPKIPAFYALAIILHKVVGLHYNEIAYIPLFLFPLSLIIYAIAVKISSSGMLSLIPIVIILTFGWSHIIRFWVHSMGYLLFFSAVLLLFNTLILSNSRKNTVLLIILIIVINWTSYKAVSLLLFLLLLLIFILYKFIDNYKYIQKRLLTYLLITLIVIFNFNIILYYKVIPSFVTFTLGIDNIVYYNLSNNYRFYQNMFVIYLNRIRLSILLLFNIIILIYIIRKYIKRNFLENDYIYYAIYIGSIFSSIVSFIIYTINGHPDFIPLILITIIIGLPVIFRLEIFYNKRDYRSLFLVGICIILIIINILFLNELVKNNLIQENNPTFEAVSIAAGFYLSYGNDIIVKSDILTRGIIMLKLASDNITPSYIANKISWLNSEEYTKLILQKKDNIRHQTLFLINYYVIHPQVERWLKLRSFDAYRSNLVLSERLNIIYTNNYCSFLLSE